MRMDLGPVIDPLDAGCLNCENVRYIIARCGGGPIIMALRLLRAKPIG